MDAAGRAMDLEDMMPPDMRGGYEAVPTVTDPDEEALRHFGTVTAVIGRYGRRGRYCMDI